MKDSEKLKLIKQGIWVEEAKDNYYYYTIDEIHKRVDENEQLPQSLTFLKEFDTGLTEIIPQENRYYNQFSTQMIWFIRLDNWIVFLMFDEETQSLFWRRDIREDIHKNMVESLPVLQLLKQDNGV